MTPAELETQCRDLYNASGDPHFTKLQIYTTAYQGEQELALECFLIEATTTTASVASTQTIAFPTNAIAIRRVEYDGKKLKATILESDPKNSTTEVTGTPASYGIWNDTIYLYPTPSSAKTVKIFHYNDATQLTTASTAFSIPARYHTHLIDLVLSAMYAKDQNTKMASYHRNLWEQNVNQIKRARRKEKRGDSFLVVREYTEQNYTGGIVV